jgi:membrane dipeptidase
VEKILSHTPLIGMKTPSHLQGIWLTCLIDGHNDLPITIRASYGNHIYDGEFKDRFEKGTMPGHVDLPRLRSGMTGGAFWSVFWLCPANGTDFSDENYASSE